MDKDMIEKHLHKIDMNLVRIDENLKEHMRRTEAAEAGLDELKKALKPVTAHVNHMEGALKFVGLLSVISTVAASLYQLLA